MSYGLTILKHYSRSSPKIGHAIICMVVFLGFNKYIYIRYLVVLSCITTFMVMTRMVANGKKVFSIDPFVTL